MAAKRQKTDQSDADVMETDSELTGSVFLQQTSTSNDGMNTLLDEHAHWVKEEPLYYIAPDQDPYRPRVHTETSVNSLEPELDRLVGELTTEQGFVWNQSSASTLASGESSSLLPDQTTSLSTPLNQPVNPQVGPFTSNSANYVGRTTLTTAAHEAEMPNQTHKPESRILDTKTNSITNGKHNNLNTMPRKLVPNSSDNHPNPICVHCNTPVRPAGRTVPDTAIRFTCHSCEQENIRSSAKPPRKPDRGKGWNQRNGDRFDFIPMAWDINEKVVQARCKYCVTAYRATFGVSGLNKHIMTPHHKHNINLFEQASRGSSRSRSLGSLSSGRGSDSGSVRRRSNEGMDMAKLRDLNDEQQQNYSSAASIGSSDFHSTQQSVHSPLEGNDRAVPIKPWHLPKRRRFVSHAGQLLQICGPDFTVEPVVNSTIEAGIVGIAVASCDTSESESSCECIVDGRVTIVQANLNQLVQFSECSFHGMYSLTVKGFNVGISNSRQTSGALLVMLHPRGPCVAPEGSLLGLGDRVSESSKKRKWTVGADRAYPFRKKVVAEDILPGDLVGLIAGKVSKLATIPRENLAHVQHFMVCATYPDNPAGELYPGGRAGSSWCTCVVVGMAPLKVVSYDNGGFGSTNQSSDNPHDQIHNSEYQHDQIQNSEYQHDQIQNSEYQHDQIQNPDIKTFAIDSIPWYTCTKEHNSNETVLFGVDKTTGLLYRCHAESTQNLHIVGVHQRSLPIEIEINLSTHVMVFVNFNPQVCERIGVLEQKLDDHEQRIKNLETIAENPKRMLWPLVPFSRLSQPLLLNSKFEEGTREWVMDAVCEWYNSPIFTPAFCLVGLAGVGKSVFASQLVCKGNKELRTLCAEQLEASVEDVQDHGNVEVVAHHFFRHDDVELAKAAMCARSINEQLCENVRGFRMVWDEQMSRLTPELVATWGPIDWFRKLVFNPASEVAQPDQRCVVVIDALDECTEKQVMAQVVSSEWSKSAPSWLGVFATGRPELFQLSTVDHNITLLNTDDHRNVVDVRKCLARHVAGVVAAEHQTKVVDELVEKSGGLFLYVRFVGELLQEACQEKKSKLGSVSEDQECKVTTDDLPNFPVGLGGVYAEFFGRLHRSLGEQYTRLLSPVAAARAPLPKYLWCKSLGLDLAAGSYDVQAKALELEQCCHNLLSFDGNVVRFVHKSMREWLTGADQAEVTALAAGLKDLAIDPTASGHQNIAVVCHAYWEDPRFEAALSSKPQHSPRKFDNNVGTFKWKSNKDARSLPSTKDCDPFRNPNVISYVGQQLFFHSCKANMFLFASEMVLQLSQLTRWIRVENDPANIRRDAEEYFIDEIKTRLTLEKLQSNLLTTTGTKIELLQLEKRFNVLKERVSDVDAITRVTYLASDALRRDYRELASQLLGYITPASNNSQAIRKLLSVCKSSNSDVSWWRPLRPTMYDDRQLLRVLKGHKAGLTSLCFSADGESIVSGSASGCVRVWQTVGPQQHVVSQHISTVCATAITPDNLFVVSAGNDWELFMSELRTGKPIGQPFLGHKDTVRALAISPTEQVVVSGSDDSTVRVWDLMTQTCLATLEGHRDSVTCVGFYCDGGIFTGSRDGTVLLWDWQSSTIRHRFDVAAGDVTCLSVVCDHDGDATLFVGGGKNICIWQIKSNAQKELVIVGPKVVETGFNVCSISTSQVGELLGVVSGVDNIVRIWDVPKLLRASSKVLPKEVVSPSPRPLECVTLSNTNNVYIAAGGRQGQTIQVWSAETVLNTGSIQDRNTDEVFASIFGNPVHVANSMYTLRKLLTPPNPHKQRDLVHVVAMSRNGKWIATGSATGVVYLWSATTGMAICVATGHSQAVRALAFSRDSKLLASGSDDQTIRVFYIKTKRNCGEPLHHQSAVTSLAFSRSRQLAAGLFDGRVRQWNCSLLSIGLITRRNAFKAHTSLVCGTAYSPKGKTLATSSFDFTIRLWDADNGVMVANIIRVPYCAASLAFSDVGDALIAVGDGGNSHNGELEEQQLGDNSGSNTLVYSVSQLETANVVISPWELSEYTREACKLETPLIEGAPCIPLCTPIPIQVDRSGAVGVPGATNGVGFTLGLGEATGAFLVRSPDLHPSSITSPCTSNKSSISSTIRAYILEDTRLHMLELVPPVSTASRSNTMKAESRHVSLSRDQSQDSISLQGLMAEQGSTRLINEKGDTSSSLAIEICDTSVSDNIPAALAIASPEARLWEKREQQDGSNDTIANSNKDSTGKKIAKKVKENTAAMYGWCTGSQWRSAWFRHLFGKRMEIARTEEIDEKVVQDEKFPVDLAWICSSLSDSIQQQDEVTSVRVSLLLQSCSRIVYLLPKLSRTLYFAKTHLDDINQKLEEQVRMFAKSIGLSDWTMVTVDHLLLPVIQGDVDIVVPDTSLLLSMLTTVSVLRRVLEALARKPKATVPQVCLDVYVRYLSSMHSFSMQQLFHQTLLDVTNREQLMKWLQLGHLSLNDQCTQLGEWAQQVKAVEDSTHDSVQRLLVEL